MYLKKYFMKKVKLGNFGFAFLLLAAFAACNDSAESTDDAIDSLRKDSIDRANNSRLNDSALQNKDAQWVSEVLESNFAEIELAKQAQQKATNKEIKNLAMMLEKD